MIANVTEQLWIDFGLDSAVFLDSIAYWLKTNANNKQPRNYREGRYWTYNTLDALHGMFPGWSKDTIRGIIRKCVKNGLLIVGNFNKKKYDRTCWYSLTDKAIEYYPALSLIIQQKADNPGGVSCGDFASPCGESPTPIPKLLPTRKDINNSEFDNSPAAATKEKPKKPKADLVFLMSLINVYREVFPDNPQPHKKVIATSLQRTLLTLVKRWPELDPDGHALTPEAFHRYLTLLRTTAPKFSLSEYVTDQGNRKKNNLETFARWNTVVKFLEKAYS